MLMHMDIQFSQHHLLKSVFSSIEWSWQPCQKSFDHLCGCLFLDSLFRYSVSVFMLVPCCFDYCSFVISFEIRKCDTSNFVFLFQGCFGSLGVP